MNLFEFIAHLKIFGLVVYANHSNVNSKWLHRLLKWKNTKSSYHLSKTKALSLYIEYLHSVALNRNAKQSLFHVLQDCTGIWCFACLAWLLLHTLYISIVICTKYYQSLITNYLTIYVNEVCSFSFCQLSRKHKERKEDT